MSRSPFYGDRPLLEAENGRQCQLDILWERCKEVEMQLELKINENTVLSSLLKEEAQRSKGALEAVQIGTKIVEETPTVPDVSLLKLQDSEKHCESLESEVKELKATVAAYENNLQAFFDAQASHEPDWDGINVRFDERIKRIHALYRLSSTIKEEADAIKEENHKSQAAYAALSTELEEMKEKLYIETFNKTEIEKELSEMKEIADSTTSKLCETLNEVDMLKTERSYSTGREERLKKELAALKSDYDNVNELKGEHVESIEALNKEMDQYILKQMELMNDLNMDVTKGRERVIELEKQLESNEQQRLLYNEEISMKWSLMLNEKEKTDRELLDLKKVLEEMEEKFIDAENCIKLKDEKLAILMEAEKEMKEKLQNAAQYIKEESKDDAFEMQAIDDTKRMDIMEGVTGLEATEEREVLKEMEEMESYMEAEKLKGVKEGPEVEEDQLTPSEERSTVIEREGVESLEAPYIKDEPKASCNHAFSETEGDTRNKKLLPRRVRYRHRRRRCRSFKNKFLERSFCLVCAPHLRIDFGRRKSIFRELRHISSIDTLHSIVEENKVDGNSKVIDEQLCNASGVECIERDEAPTTPRQNEIPTLLEKAIAPTEEPADVKASTPVKVEAPEGLAIGVKIAKTNEHADYGNAIESNASPYESTVKVRRSKRLLKTEGEPQDEHTSKVLKAPPRKKGKKAT